jgi:hypothetical protein
MVSWYTHDGGSIYTNSMYVFARGRKEPADIWVILGIRSLSLILLRHCRFRDPKVSVSNIEAVSVRYPLDCGIDIVSDDAWWSD